MYSKRIKLIVVAANLCLSIAFLNGIRVVLETLAYDNEMDLLESVLRRAGHSDKSVKHSHSVGDRLHYVQDEILLCIVFGSIWLAGRGLAKLLARVERGPEQEQRNRLAERLAASVERGGTKDGERQSFALYLRPFVLERSLLVWISGTGSEETDSLESGIVTFDRFLQEHFNYLDIPLISLGTHMEREGAGHVLTTDEKWRDRFRKLAGRATVIVVVPGMSDGILEEITWLIEKDLLAKTVFFKPNGYPRAAWQKMKALHKEKDGLDFPEYSAKQVSFRLKSSGTYHDFRTWPTVSDRRTMRHSLGQMRALLVGRSADVS